MKLTGAWQALKNTLLGSGPAPGNAGSIVQCVPDGFPLNSASPDFQGQTTINELYATIPEPKVAWKFQPLQNPIVRRVLDGSAVERLAVLAATLARRVWLEQEARRKGSMDAVVCEFRGILGKVGLLLYRRIDTWTAELIEPVITTVAAAIAQTHTRYFESDIPVLIKICESVTASAPVPAGLRQALLHLRSSLSTKGEWEGAERRRTKEQIDRIVGSTSDPNAMATSRKPQVLSRQDAWAQSFCDYLTALDDLQGRAWDELIRHSRTATQTNPTGKWLKEADRLLVAVGKDEFKVRMVELLPSVRSSATTDAMGLLSQRPITDHNAEVLKGFVWCCSRFDDGDVTRAISDLAQACYRKVTGWGPLSGKVGNACLFTLSQLPGLAPVSQLSRLRLKIKYAAAVRLIDRALEDVATKLGMSSDELEEIAVPTYGLDEAGCLREELGEFTAELRITGTHATELNWVKPGGQTQKTVPAQVKENFAADLKELKRTAQDIEKMLPAQRDRIERLLLSEREWEFEKWAERYLNHPLMAHVVRRLVWHFRTRDRSALACWHDGKLRDVEDRALDWLSTETRVRLWHPLGFDVDTVEAWRRWLESRQITQPFKQAHREIYILTEAEQRTATYSNRFAAHIIKQHQFAALTKQRGWIFRLQGAFDSHNTPTLMLPRWNLVAQFWVDAAACGNDSTSASGIYLNLATDQVRFCDPSGEPRPLAEVPALVFSEVMRDVDLFVGVCSVANDPAWQDSGEAGPHQAYWSAISFGDLSATAKTRREILERLLPRLKIANQCSLEEKFLIVRGQLRTYKIHLGSGNILMSPNNQYLCIVADRGGTTRDGHNVFLPYEGDNTLSIILSKAFLLSADEKIKDPTIASQIRRG